MSLRKRISASRESSARARAKRREERRRAERAKRQATASASKAEASPKPRAKAGTAKAAARAETAKPVAKSEAAKPASKAEAAKPVARRVSADARKLGGGAVGIGTELLKLGREMVAIPVQLWLSAAEVAGALVLRAWRVVRPLLVAVWRGLRAGVRLAERVVTPARGVIVVAVVALVALVVAQWQDYHSVSVGTDAYSGAVGSVAPAPEVETAIAGEAHAWVMVPLAVAGLIAIGVAISGRRRAAALLAPIGLAVLAIALIVDLPKGLDEGAAALSYEGASANLLEGFWIQIASGVVLVASGLLLPRYLRPLSAKERGAAPTGPSLFDRLAAATRKRLRARPDAAKRRRPRPRLRAKRKVQGAGT